MEVEEVTTPSAPRPPKLFHGNYSPLWQDDVPPITVPSNSKYPLPIASVLKWVKKYEDMLGKVANLKFMDHDITNKQRFLELVRDQYLCTNTNPGTHKTWVEA
jgi:hypothetical protein